MTISERDKKKLWARAGNQCSFPGCTEMLCNDSAVIGEMAHIYARKTGGPRGGENPGSDDYDNLILLCPKHHAEIDDNQNDWPADRLRHIKEIHEKGIKDIVDGWKGFPKPRSLIIFCGASCTGKDVVASRVQRVLSQDHGMTIDFLQKATTRRQRSDRESISKKNRIPGSLYEPSSVYTFPEDNEIVSSKKYYFQYRKYGEFRYALMRDHLASTQPEDDHLACILGCLDRVSEFRQKVRDDFERDTYAILLEADENELYKRLDLRSGFQPDERLHRRAEIAKDLVTIKRQTLKISDLNKHYNITIDNGFARLEEVVHTISKGIAQWNKWHNWQSVD